METGSLDALGMTQMKRARKDRERTKTKVGLDKKKAEVAGWDLCRGDAGCRCSESPCPFASMQRCRTCDKIQKSLCGAKKCKEQRATVGVAGAVVG